MANIESAGFVFEKLTPLRVTIMVTAAISTYLTWTFRGSISVSFVYWYAAFHFVFRQSVLMLSFTEKGIVYQLKKKYGVKKGYDIYEFITGMSFFHRSVSYVLLIEHTSLIDIPFLNPYIVYFKIISYLFIAIGLVVNTWSYLLIKRETYYYLDMYYGRFLVDFKQEGPYSWVKNPMYSLGQLPSYGTALALFSVAGLVLTTLNVISCYIFYYSFELPHIKRVLKKMEKDDIDASLLVHSY